MPEYNYPYIRDTLIINETVQKFYNNFSGPYPVFLIGRIVEHKPGFSLVLGQKPLVIVADCYDGKGGMIDARGVNGPAVGSRGADGTYPSPAYDLQGRPVAPGGSGAAGGPGSPGGPGGNVTVLCRRSVNVNISVTGGWGAAGGTGGNGGRGVDGFVTPDRTEIVDSDPFDDSPGVPILIPGETVPGTSGGNGGWGGPGGAGGNGGNIRFISITDDSYPVLDVAAGGGGSGGSGGLPGIDGHLCETSATEGSFGSDGAPGLLGQLSYTNIPDHEYLSALRAELAPYNYAKDWASFRVLTGDYFYHLHNPSIPEQSDYARLAAIEFDRALELHPGNEEATRLQSQLVGFPDPMPGSGEIVWKGGGNNALGLPPDLDVLPQFDQYMQAFTSFSGLVLEFLNMATAGLRASGQMSQLAALVALQGQQAISARDRTRDNVEIVVAEQTYANDEATYAKQQLDQVSRDIQAAYEEMQQQHPDDSVFGTLVSIGAAVVSVVAAVPSGGASLVVLVPSMMALTNSVISNAGSIAEDLFKEESASREAVEKAYKKVDKKLTAVIAGGKSIINFVSLVEKLNARSTPDNAKYMALVKRGVELTHEVLLSNHRVTIAEQRVKAVRAQLVREEGIVVATADLQSNLTSDAASVKKSASLLALQTIRARIDALLSLAFMAQRSAEIYTLQDEGRHLLLNTGLICPDEERAYYEEEFEEDRLVNLLQTSWAKILAPLNIQSNYASFVAQMHVQDTYRKRFGEGPEIDALKSEHRFTFRVDVSDLPQEHFYTKVKSVRLAFVGASNLSGEISCEVRHGGRYEQRRRDGTIAIQDLKPRLSIRNAKTTRLLPDEGLDDDPPLTDPRSLTFWGRGIGGDWELTIPESQFASGDLDLSDVTEIQVWIGYQFIY